MHTTILKVAIISRNTSNLFDYLPPSTIDPTSIKVGSRLLVPFRREKLIGILIEKGTTSNLEDAKLKHIDTILDGSTNLISINLINLFHWSANYYHYNISKIISHFLPTLIKKNKDLSSINDSFFIIDKINLKNLKPQKNAYRQHEAIKVLKQYSETIVSQSELKAKLLTTEIIKKFEEKKILIKT